MEKFEITVIWKNGSHGIHTFHSYDDMITFIFANRPEIEHVWERN